MFSSSLVMSSTLLKIGVRKEDEHAEEEGGEWGRVKMGGWCMAEPSQWRMPVIAMFIKLSFSTVVRFIKLSLSTGCIVHQTVILVKCLNRPILSLYEGMVKISIPKKLGDYECQQMAFVMKHSWQTQRSKWTKQVGWVGKLTNII